MLPAVQVVNVVKAFIIPLGSTTTTGVDANKAAIQKQQVGGAGVWGGAGL